MSRTPRGERRHSPIGVVVLLLECMFDRQSLAPLRRDLGRCGRANGLNDRLLSDLVLAVNEITTNAVRHGGGRGRLRLWSDEHSLWCEVGDDGPGIPSERLDETRRRSPGPIGGNGLWLTHQICDDVDIETGGLGTRVVMRYGLRPAIS